MVANGRDRATAGIDGRCDGLRLQFDGKSDRGGDQERDGGWDVGNAQPLGAFELNGYVDVTPR